MYVMYLGLYLSIEVLWVSVGQRAAKLWSIKLETILLSGSRTQAAFRWFDSGREAKFFDTAFDSKGFLIPQTRPGPRLRIRPHHHLQDPQTLSLPNRRHHSPPFLQNQKIRHSPLPPMPEHRSSLQILPKTQ